MGNAGGVVGEHQRVTEELRDVEKESEDARSVWSMVISWRNRWQRRTGDSGMNRRSLEPNNGSQRRGALAWSS
jgi:hypothetical protein